MDEKCFKLDEKITPKWMKNAPKQKGTKINENCIKVNEKATKWMKIVPQWIKKMAPKWMVNAPKYIGKMA